MWYVIKGLIWHAARRLMKRFTVLNFMTDQDDDVQIAQPTVKTDNNSPKITIIYYAAIHKRRILS